MLDVLILYEHRNREIENCVLLLEELSYRGYKVRIESIFSPWKYFRNPKVLVVPHLYNEDQLIHFAKNIWLNNTNILSLQYEQVLSKGCRDNAEDLHRPSGQAKYAHHVSWGKSQTHRYLEGGIQKENIHETGFISMDLLRSEFISYQKSKKDIADEFNLDSQKEWILFISSFSHANRTEEEIARFEKLNHLSPLFAKVTSESYPVIIEWLKRAAIDFPNKIFIYRPHPAEKFDANLKKIEESCPNFRCINKYSMRQWAYVIDFAFNWISTSATDLYFAKKPCFLLRPIAIPEVLDMDILTGVPRLSTYQEIFSVLNNNISKEILKKNSTIEYYYGTNEGRMAFLQTADICEKMIKNEIKGYSFDYGTSRFNMTNAMNWKQILWEYLKMFSFFIFSLFKIEKIPILSKKQNEKLRRYKTDVYSIEKDIHHYSGRFHAVLKKIHVV